MLKKVLKGLSVAIVSLALFAVFSTTKSSNNEASAATIASFSQVNRVAQSKLGTPYSFGSVGPSRFDCSGFTKFLMKQGANKSIPRTAQAQYKKSKHVAKKNIKAGDLVFFGRNKHHITHVGFAISHTKMIDAQNRGVITEKIHAPWWHLVAVARPVTMIQDQNQPQPQPVQEPEQN